MSAWNLHLGDCLDVLKTLPDASVDAVVTDPPYELGFMGKRWDASGIAYNVSLWTETLRVLKPGGHLLSFGGTRTYHRMACAIEDAGFEVRDSLHWIYGSGFPKSLDVSKAIDKAAGAEREILGVSPNDRASKVKGGRGFDKALDKGQAHEPVLLTAPATDAARQWDGWGTALKPAHEPVVVARKPLVGTVAANVQQHGTGALNIDGCRVGTTDKLGGGHASSGQQMTGGWRRPWMDDAEAVAANAARSRAAVEKAEQFGRWPPNILLSHTPECGEACAEDCAVAEMDRQSGVAKPKPRREGVRGGNGFGMFDDAKSAAASGVWPEDAGGGASRFFPVFRYQAKASRSERERGLNEGQKATHPTVKPVELMRWLVRLVTPPGGVVLDPFTGSGTTGVAATLEGARFIGIEREAEYHAIATARIQHATASRDRVAQSRAAPANGDLFADLA